MKVAEAAIDDIPQLCGLLNALFSQEADFEPDTDRQKAGLTQIIENPDVGRILVMRRDDQLIGMVNLLFTVSTALGGKAAILEDMVIHPEYRGGGIGGKLLSSAIDLAKSLNCLRITLLTDASNTQAQRFYERHGFSASGMVPFRLVFAD